jgi:hypothetical protein
MRARHPSRILTAFGFAAILTLFLAGVSCMVQPSGSSSQPAGNLGGVCFANDTCNAGLECNTDTNRCVEEGAEGEGEGEGEG